MFGIIFLCMFITGIASGRAEDLDRTIIHSSPAEPWDPAHLTADQSLFLEVRALTGHKLLEALKAGALAGNIHAIRETAIYYSQIKDYPKSVHWWRIGAKKGDPHSEYELGYFLLQGPDVPHNRKKAIFWLKKAAADNSIHGRDLLASIYLSEPGKDGLAVEQWHKAAQAGSSWSAHMIALGYKNGLYGLPKDQKKYKEWERIRKKLRLAYIHKLFQRPDFYQAYLRDKSIYDYYSHHGTLPSNKSLTAPKPKFNQKLYSYIFYLFFFGCVVLITIGMFYQKKRTRALPQGASPFFWLLITIFAFGFSITGWIWLVFVPLGDHIYYFLIGVCYGIQSILAYQIWQISKSGDTQKTEKITHQA